MIKRKGMVDTSRRPNLHITGISEREHHLKTGKDVNFHSYIKVQAIVIQAETV